MPINPHTEPVAARAWADQFGTAVRARGLAILEEALHHGGLCSEELDINLVLLLSTAVEAGACAMGVELGEYDRLKEVDA